MCREMRWLGALLLLLSPSVAAATWWDISWGHRAVILCGNNNKSATTLTGFTCDIELDSSPGTSCVGLSANANTVCTYPFTYAESLSANGGDIRVLDSDDATELPYEIVRWDGPNDAKCTSGHCSIIRTKVTITSGTHEVHLYWGKSSVTTTQNAANTYDSGTKQVLHLEEASGTTATDAVGLHNGTITTGTGTAYNATAVDSTGLNLHATNDDISTADSNDFTPSAFVVNLWLNPNAAIASGANLGIAAKMSSGATDDDWAFRVAANAFSLDAFICNTATGTCSVNIGGVVPSAAPTPGIWTHYAFRWTGGTTDASIHLYRNGAALVPTPNGSGTFTAIHNGGQAMLVGAFRSASSGNLDAVVDEVRFDAVDRTDDWIKAVYDSTRGAFDTASAEETAPTPTPTQTPTQTPTGTPTNTPVPWNLAAVQQSTPIRTPIAGVISDTWTHNEGTPPAGDEEWQEAAANGNQNVEYDFGTQQAAPANAHITLEFWGFYNGTHPLLLECSANESTYQPCATLATSQSASQHLGCDLTANACIATSATVPTPITHIRLRHPTPGDAAHDWFIDQAILRTATATETATPTPTATLQFSATPTHTNTPTATPTPTPTPSPTNVVCWTPNNAGNCPAPPSPGRVNACGTPTP